ncbi:hypothetical protein ACQBAU_07780 [Propionibacteriaceae bacterium Y2011]|uniref:hypothetical protein n=1 Tax=Microlunatus sp. Y2014 TaxID=3418488 RepID=UPI003B4CBAD0
MGFADWVARMMGEEEPEPADTPPAPPTEEDILAALDRVVQMAADAKAPSLVRSRLARIANTIRLTLPRLRNLGLGSPEAYSVMATATDYLPEALGGYLRLPRDWADSRPIDNGKTSLLLLVDQLDLLGATMDQVFDAVNRADAEALIAHGRFLQAKFGHDSSGGSLDLNKVSTPSQRTSATAPSSSRPTGPGSSPQPPTRPRETPRSMLDLES